MRAVLFCLVWFGFKPRVATELSNAAKPRIERICQLIQASKYSIHDLSRCQASQVDELYRLNMPFELGVDFSCRRYGDFQTWYIERQRAKGFLEEDIQDHPTSELLEEMLNWFDEGKPRTEQYFD